MLEGAYFMCLCLPGLSFPRAEYVLSCLQSVFPGSCVKSRSDGDNTETANQSVFWRAYINTAERVSRLSLTRKHKWSAHL